MPRVLLRRYRPGDEEQISSLMLEATMATVFPFFRALAAREVVTQSALLLSAVCFVVAGCPLLYSLGSLPAVLAVAYAGVWVAHRVKAAGHVDLGNMGAVYASSNRTGFWVAEAFEDGSPEVSYQVEGEDSDGQPPGLATGDGGRLVGTVAVVVKEDPDMREPPGSVAWLRRMAVERSFRRRGLGSRLVDVALDHCLRSGFRACELITTEAHEAARCLYSRRGFELVQRYQDTYLFGLVSVSMFRFRRACVGVRDGLI